MKRISLEMTETVDRASFHEAFKELLGFPVWYGANMDAWIDYMSDLTTPNTGLPSSN